WNSGWFRTYQYFLPIQGKSQFMFVVDKSFFELVKTAPATLHISLALTGFRAQAVRRLVASAGDFEVPGEAICSMWLHESDALHCRSPLGRPFLGLTVLPQESTCARDKSQKEQYGNSALGGVSSWGSYRSSGPALSPVETFYLPLWRERRSRPEYSPPNVLCPGTPLNFEILREDRRTRGALTIQGIRLADYEPKQWSSSGVGFGFAVAR